MPRLSVQLYDDERVYICEHYLTMPPSDSAQVMFRFKSFKDMCPFLNYRG